MSSFLRSANKKMQRQSEKLMQMVGKREGTKDEEYEELVANFNRQQAQATRLHKEAQNYLKSLKGMMQASKQFGEAVKAVYEPDWPDSNETYTAIEEMDSVFLELQDKLSTQVVDPVYEHLQKFPDFKARIAKRDRKVIDFDRARRALEVAREKQSAKLAQAEKEFADAERLFKEVNDEVHGMLPDFSASRVHTYSHILSTFYQIDIDFHARTTAIDERIKKNLEALADNEELTSVPERVRADSAGSADPPAAQAAAPAAAAADSEPEPEPEQPADEDLPSDVLSVRIATHAYEGQDEDELTFEKGARIEVIPFADPDDEDEGWLNGRLESGRTGVFPQNFTREA